MIKELNMPSLPKLFRELFPELGSVVYDALSDQVHNYAQAYANQQVAELQVKLAAAEKRIAELRDALDFGVDLYDDSKSSRDNSMALYEWCCVASAALTQKEIQ